MAGFIFSESFLQLRLDCYVLFLAHPFLGNRTNNCACRYIDVQHKTVLHNDTQNLKFRKIVSKNTYYWLRAHTTCESHLLAANCTAVLLLLAVFIIVFLLVIRVGGGVQTRACTFVYDLQQVTS